VGEQRLFSQAGSTGFLLVLLCFKYILAVVAATGNSRSGGYNMSMTCLLFPPGSSGRTASSFAGWFDRISARIVMFQVYVSSSGCYR